METKSRPSQRLSPSEVKQRLDRGEKLTIIDARNEQAWSDSDAKIPGALRMPLSEFEANRIPKDRPVITYCT